LATEFVTDNCGEGAGAADINDRLKMTRGFQGAAGQISFDPENRANEDGLIFRILNGALIRVQ